MMQTTTKKSKKSRGKIFGVPEYPKFELIVKPRMFGVVIRLD